MNSTIKTNLPNFFVIGAPKAGTSALYFCLKQHPHIYMSHIKEPHYFTFQGKAPVFSGPKGDHFQRVGVCIPRDYLFLFAGATTQKAIGEASTTYLHSPIAAQRISNFAPEAKIVVLLRQPADRAYSHYQYLRSQGAEHSHNFADAIAQESSRKNAGWFHGHLYKDGGYYFSQLIRYYNVFQRNQIKIFLYEEWNQSPFDVIRELYKFLNVDEDFVPEIHRNNVTLIPISHKFNRLAKHPNIVENIMAPLIPAPVRKKVFSGIQKLNSLYNLYPPLPIDADIRRKLTAGYREDILKLQALIDRDLSHWLEP